MIQKFRELFPLGEKQCRGLFFGKKKEKKQSSIWNSLFQSDSLSLRGI